MKIAVLTANLGEFDSTPLDPVKQNLPDGVEMTFHRFTDKDFPPITGLTPRFQYRIPKLFGWQMFPGYDIYLWHDSSMSLQHPDSVKWFLDQLWHVDMAFFKHPWRKTIREEVEHIEKKLAEGSKYLNSRYKNGLHREQLEGIIENDVDFVDNRLFASTAFIYKDIDDTRDVFDTWWYHQSRYYTCDQVSLPYALFNADVSVSTINEDIFKSPYISLVSKHK